MLERFGDEQNWLHRVTQTRVASEAICALRELKMDIARSGSESLEFPHEAISVQALKH